MIIISETSRVRIKRWSFIDKKKLLRKIVNRVLNYNEIKRA